jgi:pimeloyl-ACP methyl ester carboxylesterase
MREVLRCDVMAELAQVRAPILYLQAAQDRVVDLECLGEMHEVMPGRTVAIDGPHLLVQTEPQLVAEVVAGFVRESE